MTSILRKKRTLIKVASFIVATVTFISVGMVIQLQHAMDRGFMSMDYDFDLKEDLKFPSNGFDLHSNDEGVHNDDLHPVNLLRRDTLAIKNDYGYVNGANKNSALNSNKANQNIDSGIQKALRKTEGNNKVLFEKDRNKELNYKQKQLENLDSEELGDLSDIVDETVDSDYEYEYKNNNPVFKPGDFDVSENFYNGKIKSVEGKEKENYNDDEEETYEDVNEEESVENEENIQNEKENNVDNMKQAAAGIESFLVKSSELAGGVINTNLLHSAVGISDENVKSGPCRGAQNCSVNNEIHSVRSNGKMRANMPSNNHANLSEFHVSEHKKPHQYNDQQTNNNNRDGNLNRNVNKLHNSVIENIETQIPVQDEFVLFALEYPGTQVQPNSLLRQRVDVTSKYGVPIVVDKIYWSNEALEFVSKGISEEEFQSFLNNVSRQSVTVMRDPKWNQCGRPKNQYVELADGTVMCARYRHPHVDLVQGEILSFYLSRFLGMDNIPPVLLTKVNSNTTQWSRVKSRIYHANWQQNSLVALILWIDNIESREYMPSVILDAFEHNTSLTLNNSKLASMTSLQLADVIQWTDLILFDYLTGNYDRVASMQDGAEREHKPSIMHESIRNLRRDKASGRLWFIDNESGLLDAYELMYSKTLKDEPSRFVRFHTKMLKTICIFNPTTVRKIRQMAQHAAPHELLVKYALQQDELFTMFSWTKSLELFEKHFHTRLRDVVHWLAKCESM